MAHLAFMGDRIPDLEHNIFMEGTGPWMGDVVAALEEGGLYCRGKMDQVKPRCLYVFRSLETYNLTGRPRGLLMHVIPHPPGGVEVVFRRFNRGRTLPISLAQWQDLNPASDAEERELDRRRGHLVDSKESFEEFIGLLHQTVQAYDGVYP